MPTLGIDPTKKPRVLKERRIGRVSGTSIPPFLCGVPSEHTDSVDAVPRAMPWAGMRCPFRAYWTITVSIPWAHRVPDTGPATACPLTGRPTRFRSRGPLLRVRYRTPTVFPLPDPPTRCPIPCPEGGIAYQPRVPTLGIDPEKKPRVLKERRIGRVSRTSTSLFVVCVANGVNRRRSTSGGCWLTRTHPSCLRGPSTRTGSLGG